MNKTSKSKICLFQRINFSDKESVSNFLKFIHTHIIYLFLNLLLFFNLTSCDTTEPPIIPPPAVVKDTITVSIESFTHRSISVNVHATANSKQSAIRVLRSFNNTTTTIAECPIQTKDTTITDDDNGTGLLLDTTYTYFAIRIDSLGQLKDTSNIVTQKTLAPTSHNYTWQEFTIGDAGFSNTLYDVWGTDENNVYACGGITINDTVYGILHWNGVEWKPISKAGGVAILGFSNSDIWTVGGAIFHFNGTEWRDLTNINSVFHDNQPYTSIWGTSSSNLYLGNAWGKIIHWDGSNASIVYENTNDIPITDIYGLSTDFIIATGGSSTPPSVTVKYQNHNWSEVSGLASFKLYYTSYPISTNEYYVAGENIMRYWNNNWIKVVADTINVINRLRGNKQTGDIFAVGHNTTILHYNGIDWYQFTLPASGFDPLQSLYITSTKIFVVGIQDSKAKIIIGTQLQ